MSKGCVFKICLTLPEGKQKVGVPIYLKIVWYLQKKSYKNCKQFCVS